MKYILLKNLKQREKLKTFLEKKYIVFHIMNHYICLKSEANSVNIN